MTKKNKNKRSSYYVPLLVGVAGLLVGLVKTSSAGKDRDSCSATITEEGAQLSDSCIGIARLRPDELPKPAVFSDFTHNDSVAIQWEGEELSQTVAFGSVTQINNVKKETKVDVDFALLPSIVDRESVDEMLGLLRAHSSFDEDPDTVDGMPTYEMFVDSIDMDDRQSLKVRNFDPERIALREKLQKIMNPILEHKITPMVRRNYPEACARGGGRDCTPCYSLIRRYRHGERQSHATHHDGHAIATVVVSLSDYGEDFSGGLYVSTSQGHREYLALRKGDAALHRSTLFHGVKVLDLEDHPEKTERWSWIMWYRDSEKCDDLSHEWYSGCAEEGDPICQELHSDKVGSVPGISKEETVRQMLHLNHEAAYGGASTSAVKLGRAYLGRLPSTLPYSEKDARKFFALATESHNPEGHYGLAELELMACGDHCGLQDSQKVIWHLEEAAKRLHPFSMFNLGIVHMFGLGTNVDRHLASAWFVASGLPEGYFVASRLANGMGDAAGAEKYAKTAQTLGMGHQWRQQAREHTGSGGAGGVSINLPWPKARDGQEIPKI